MKKWDLLYSSEGINDYVTAGDLSDFDMNQEEEVIRFWLRVKGEPLFYWSPMRVRWVNVREEHTYREGDVRKIIFKLLTETFNNEAIEVRPLSFLIQIGLNFYDTLPEELR